MLTIGDTAGAMLKLIIPNHNVRRQYYDYLLEEYSNINPIETYPLNMAFYQAAVEGDWHPMMEQIMTAYSETTSVRSLIEGERNLQGFMNAYLTLNPYYLVAPEMELNHGYCDFFLMPDLMRYPMVEHSYILELKYLKKDESEAAAQQQWAEAVEQIHQYAEGRVVKRLIQHTQLHLIVVQVRGYELQKMMEIEKIA